MNNHMVGAWKRAARPIGNSFLVNGFRRSEIWRGYELFSVLVQRKTGASSRK